AGGAAGADRCRRADLHLRPVPAGTPPAQLRHRRRPALTRALERAAAQHLGAGQQLTAPAVQPALRLVLQWPDFDAVALAGAKVGRAHAQQAGCLAWFVIDSAAGHFELKAQLQLMGAWTELEIAAIAAWRAVQAVRHQCVSG